jgi:hypothetical protein
MTHVMLDIETLGREPGCVVLSIGAVTFDPHVPEGTEIYGARSFEALIAPASCLEYGMDIESDTFKWWLTQGAEAFHYAMSGTEKLYQVLGGFALWLESVGMTELWAKSPQFDCSILAGAYRKTGQALPWGYRQPRDLRTLLALAGSNFPAVPMTGIEHRALDDAAHQVRQACAAMRHLKLA